MLWIFLIKQNSGGDSIGTFWARTSRLLSRPHPPVFSSHLTAPQLIHHPDQEPRRHLWILSFSSLPPWNPIHPPCSTFKIYPSSLFITATVILVQTTTPPTWVVFTISNCPPCLPSGLSPVIFHRAARVLFRTHKSGHALSTWKLPSGANHSK